MDLDLMLVWRSLPLLLDGALITLKLTSAAVGIGLVIGTIIGIARLSRFAVFRIPAAIYVDFIRGTPLIVQIFIVYMGLPQLIGPVPQLVAALSALGANSGAYIAEIVRAGIQSIHRGQREAAESLGMTPWQTLRYVILPQAFRRIIPPLGNEFIAMLKDSALVSVISMEELLRRGTIIIGRTFRPFEIYMTVAVLYLIMTLGISRLVSFTEKKLRVGSQG